VGCIFVALVSEVINHSVSCGMEVLYFHTMFSLCCGITQKQKVPEVLTTLLNSELYTGTGKSLCIVVYSLYFVCS